MTRNEFAATLAQRFPSLTHADVAECVRLLLTTMAEAIVAGRRIEIRGFGNFCLHFRPPRNSRNPKTGEKLKIPGKWMPHFRSGKAIKEALGPGSPTARQEGDSVRMRQDRDIETDGPSPTTSRLIEAAG
jgi:integration host factor subunit beta